MAIVPIIATQESIMLLGLLNHTTGLIKFGILFLDAKFAKNKNSKFPKLSGCLYVWVYDLAASSYSMAANGYKIAANDYKIAAIVATIVRAA